MPKKRFGQNFLKAESVIQKILHFFNAQSDDNVIEIGPGQGALTQPLLTQLKKLHAIEIDKDLIERLQKQNINHLILHESDVLKFDFNQLDKEKPFRFIGNLPYNISTQLILKLINYKSNINDMLFMVQKEVALRLTATPNHKNYGRLSVMVQVAFDVHYVLHVPPDSFYPMPKVDSAIVYFTPTKTNYPIKNFPEFQLLVKTAFSSRRKTLANNLKSWGGKALLNEHNIPENARAENVSVMQFVKLSNNLK